MEAEKRATAKEVSHMDDDVFSPERFRFVRDQFVNVHIRQPVQPHNIYIRAQSKYIEPNPKQSRTQRITKEKGETKVSMSCVDNGHCNS